MYDDDDDNFFLQQQQQQQWRPIFESNVYMYKLSSSNWCEEKIVQFDSQEKNGLLLMTMTDYFFDKIKLEIKILSLQRWILIHLSYISS